MLTDLLEGWTLQAVGGPVPAALIGRTVAASVPGCVHLDLLAADLIRDPYLDENEAELAWIGRVNWRYETSFDWAGCEPDEQVDLVAAGLDTVASVELNGTVLTRTSNMHRTHRVPVRDALRVGTNRLAVTFSAAVDAAQRESARLGPRPHVNTHPYNAIRKMACNFGWDWGPDVVTAGIWRPIGLQTWRGARLRAVRPLVDVEGSTGIARVHVEIERSADVDGPLPVHVRVGDVNRDVVVDAGASEAVVEVRVEAAQLWWPHGLGSQPLYPVTVDLQATQRSSASRWSGRIGFRTVRLDCSPDEHGTSFTLRVNDVAVFARGVNWIPDDCFPSRIGRQRYRERLTQARDANVNLVRVWGGGIYESEDFYDSCDELGLLVWQDFLFACAAYAEEEPLRGEVIAEAREAVTRLAPHPSLALWNGGNENIWGYEDWEWKEPLAGRSWGWGYYTDVLPAIVAELDGTRPYTPGCPYSMSAERHPNDPAHGTTHIWDVWNQLDYTAYADYVPRFVSEFGFQGPPTWATLTSAVHDQPLEPDSPGMLAHQKAEDGNGKLARGLKAHLPVPEGIEDWHWATSLNQARAIAFGIEHFRSWRPICSGAIVWQLNDCWPVTSWAAVDGNARPKPVWYAMRHAFRDRLLTLQPRGDGLALVAVNDAPEPWSTVVRVTRRTFDGTVLASVDVAVELPGAEQSCTPLPDEVAVSGDAASELLVADDGRDRTTRMFVDDIAAALPRPQMQVVTSAVPGGYRAEATARSFVRDLSLLADRVAPDAVVDDMLVTLFPGETVGFEVRTQARVSPADFEADVVLRSANQLVNRAARLHTDA